MPSAFKCLVALLALLGLGTQPLAETPDVNPSLRGLPGVAVEVLELDDNAPLYGFERDELETLVERWLREDGVRVLSAKQLEASRAEPLLKLKVTTFRSAVVMQLMLEQHVMLTNGVSMQAITWLKRAVTELAKEVTKGPSQGAGDHGRHDGSPDSQSRDVTWIALEYAVHDFSKDFLKANPKQ